MEELSIPQATYRVQMNRHFRFKDLEEIINYLSDLGISHIYCSPILKAKSGSIHGYDVTDYNQLNPEIGSLKDFECLINSLHANSMGMIVDIVPNHMYIGNQENAWWKSILEKGQKSPVVTFFDIDWHPPKQLFDNKVFLPILDKLFGEALEKQMLQVHYLKGYFYLYVKDFILPTDPESWDLILEPLNEEIKKLLKNNHPNLKELESIINELSSPCIPTRIQKLFDQEPELLERLSKHLEVLNGVKDDPLSFDQLEIFIQKQHYRLCYWRIANEEINYRRFFDILEFASLRIENRETFHAVHALIFDLISKKWINGLRIDHIDGLWDPEKYLEDLNKKLENKIYIIAEKILTGNEKLHLDWSLQGIVGYDFLNQVNGLFIYQPYKQKIIDIYEHFIGYRENISRLKYNCKKLVLTTLLASELNLLTIRLNAIAEQHRHSQDFSFDLLKRALAEIIAFFPNYRTYMRPASGGINQNDRRAIHVAVAKAQRNDPYMDSSIYKFIRDLLFLKYPEGVNEAYKSACYDFVMHFQQVTSPVMAKGYEDTALYRYFPLSSLNEVGSDLSIFGISKEGFHKKNLDRFADWPYTQLSSTTHDTKRSEDLRARINLLSEIPDEWEKNLISWEKINRKYKIKVGKKEVPSANEEYLLYQTLLGSYPFGGIDDTYIKRIQNYMRKAISEAKINSSWLYPNEAYLESVEEFVNKICYDSEFLQDFESLFFKISELGMLNSLSQLILKLTSPGIPDIYQGNEFWDFSLVDPDNRHVIDYSVNKQKISKLKTFKNCLDTPRDGLIKYFITKQILELRHAKSNIFKDGIYLLLEIEGPKEKFVIAYARILDNHAVIVLTTRFFTFFMSRFDDKSDFFFETMIRLPDILANYHFRDIFSNQVYIPSRELKLKDVFSMIPFAVLESFYE